MLSHHNNRIEFAVPPLMVLPEQLQHLPGQNRFERSGKSAEDYLARRADLVDLVVPEAVADREAAQVEDLAAARKKLR